MKKIFCALIAVFFWHVGAEPITPINIKVKVVRVDANWAWVKYADKTVRLPKAVVPDLHSKNTQEVGLTEDQYNTMKRDYFLGQT